MEIMQPDDEKQWPRMKKFDFVITLKRPDYKSVDAISLLMCFFAIVVFIYTAIQNETHYIFNFSVSAIIVACCIYNLIQNRAKQFNASYAMPLFICCMTLLIVVKEPANYFFAPFFLIAFILEKRAKTDLKIEVDENEITFTSFPQKKSSWNELNNVLIKDGIITIDYKNNKLIQKDIQEEVSAEREKEFNEFCKKQINVFVNSQNK
jgi:hypothetical protein